MQLIQYWESDKIKNAIRCKKNINRSIIFIEPYGASLSLLKHGFDQGYNIIILTANTDLRIVPEKIINCSTLTVEVDTTNELQLKSVLETIIDMTPIDAVIPGFEYFVPISIKLANYLNLASIKNENIEKVRCKDKMRDALVTAQLNCPKYIKVHDYYEIENAIQKIGFPAVCKPIDAAGSVYVQKVNTMAETFTAAQRILSGTECLWGHKLEPALLLEEFIEGKEYSLEGVVINGKIYFFGLTEKFVSDQMEFVETGHIVNVPLSKVTKERCQNYIATIISAIGLNFCPFHAEFRIDQSGNPVLMEIAARLAGDKIGDLINLISSHNYFDYVYAAYLNLPIHLPTLSDQYAGIQFFYRPAVNRYLSVSGVDQFDGDIANNISLYYQRGESIPDFPKPLRRLGHVILQNSCYQQLKNDLLMLDQSIVFHAE